MSKNLNITLCDLSSVQREFAEIVGIDNYIKLIKRFGGNSNIYIPTYSKLLSRSQHVEIVAKFNGCNHKELAEEYGLTARTIYNIISKKKKNSKAQ